MKKSRLKKLPLLSACMVTALAVTLQGCGGSGGKGGSGTPATINEPDSNANIDDSPGLNGELSGYLYYSDHLGNHWKLDLKTGLSQHTIFSQQEPGQEGLSFAIDSQNQQIIKAISTYEYGIGYTATFETVNAQNEPLSHFSIRGMFQPSVGVSPDGSVISVLYNVDSETWISLFDKRGNELWEYKEETYYDENSNRRGILSGYTWLDSSTILLREDTSLYRISLTDLSQKSLTIDFSRTSFETVGIPQASPDGKQLAFSASDGDASDPQNTHVYISDINGNNIRQLTNGLTGENMPVWSSDGKYVFVQTGTRRNLILFPPNYPRALYAVRASAEKAFVSPDINGTSGDAIPIKRQMEGGTIQHMWMVFSIKQPKWSF